MAQKNLKDKEAVRQENIEQTVSATEQFYNEHKKLIWGIVAAVLVVGLGILAYQELALSGDGNNLGFADIIDQYGAKAGKAVYLYAGICELRLGNNEEALSYLKKYNGKEPILAARARACEGDAYVALGDYAAAVRSYKAAVAVADNVFAAAYLVKQGTAHEALGQNAEALACYRAVEHDYPQSIEAYDIAKYIARVSE